MEIESMPDIAAKVAFLSNPRNHPFAPRAVSVVETHMSWVFLTDLHAYKLKKAMRLQGRDLTGVAAREAQCRDEVELNCRLTRGVYLGVLPLTLDREGALQLDLGGTPVDWLVWMRRLPDARMLDRMIADGAVDDERLRACVAMLGQFYRAQPRAPIDGAQWRARQAARIDENAAALRLAAGGLPAHEVERIVAGQLDFLGGNRALFDRRVSEARVVEGHGDLRPEHICLEAPPQVIDCLDFAYELRVVDAAEEVGFLALECERLGAPRLEALIFDAYRRAAADDPPAALVHFYQSVHACVRAKLAIWHLRDPGPRGPAHWSGRAREYLGLAAEHLAGATARAAA